MSIFQDISLALQKGRAKEVTELVTKAIADGVPVGSILNDGLMAGMNVIGGKFKRNEVFVPEVLIAARAMNADIVCLSALLTTTMTEMGNVVKAFEAAGTRRTVKIMIGGAPRPARRSPARLHLSVSRSTGGVF